MTRKDYIAIASALNNSRDVSTEFSADYIAGWIEAIDASARWISSAMARDNPRFDRARFLKAAGVQS